jgi:maltooligosyltrehalose trehalohydrolase
MVRGEDGWWRAGVELAAGEDYRFVVDGAALPDPRSRWQPEGVHGPSRALDPRGFAWTDGGWRTPALREQVVYELHVGTFSEEGTFDGVVAHLDHLLALGVTAVELMPVAEFAGARGWGYDGVDLYAPHHAYGGPHGLQRLVDACHARDLAVILDVVYNHLGPEGNYLSAFGPYFTDRYATPWGQAPNLDGPDSQPVRDLFIDNAVMWLRDYHVDGLRLDAVHAIVDMSALHFLEELARRVAAGAGPERWLLPESDRNDPRVAMPPARGGYGHDAHWCDDVHHAVHAVLTGERQGYYADFGRPDQLATALRRGYVYAGDYSRFRRRRHGRPHELSGDNLVACVQNHDQVGNRARGDRITETFAADASAHRPTTCHPTGSWSSTKTTTRWETGPWATGCRRRPARSRRSARCCHRSSRCCSWARSGAPRRPSRSSRRTPTRPSPRPPAAGARTSSPRSAGARRTSPTPRTRRRSPPPACAGTNRPSPPTPACWRGIGR